MKSVFASLLTVLVVGCGSSTGTSPTPGNTGNSTEACTTEDEYCQETTGPASSIEAQRSACRDAIHTVSAACTITPRIGCCGVNGGTTKVCYFGSAKTPYAQACSAARGTWTPN